MLRQVGNKKVRGRGDLSLYATIDRRLCVTVPEAAEMLGISRNFAYQLVREGKLPSIRFGKRILIPRAALEKMLERGVAQ
jgi:excisionase family DNA binding protein